MRVLRIAASINRPNKVGITENNMLLHAENRGSLLCLLYLNPEEIKRA